MSDPDDLIDDSVGGTLEKTQNGNEVKKTNFEGRLSKTKGKLRTFRGVSGLKVDRERERDEPEQEKGAADVADDHEAAYDALLRRAKAADLSRLDALRFLYRDGVDEEGRPLMVLVGAQVPAKSVDLSDLLLYAARTMDPIVHDAYSMVYFHTAFASDNKPAMSFLKNAYTSLSRSYKKNLKALIIVHPSFWIKTCARVFRPFVSAKFWSKLTYISHTDELTARLPSLKLPPVAAASPEGITRSNGAGAGGSAPKLVFGTPIEDVFDSSTHLPPFLALAFAELDRHVDVEGILRISGSVAAIALLREQVDSGRPTPDFAAAAAQDVHSVTGFLKLWMRMLPEPIVPFATYPVVVRAVREAHALDPASLGDAVIPILRSLPPPNRLFLTELLTLATRIVEHSDENQMTAKNVAIVLTPNLLRPAGDDMAITIVNTPLLNEAMRQVLSLSMDQIALNEGADSDPASSIAGSEIGEFV